MANPHNVNKGIIQTNENCVGCNKCISVCPVFSANIAVQDERGNKMYVDQDKCILCGKCMDTCTHDARVYMDDTGRFMGDLARGNNISVLLAPSFFVNYPQQHGMILGYLKHLGVNRIYSVSTGADITVWAYINYMQQQDRKGLISQPCPAIVNYIELYKPELLGRLIPVQSPVMCTAIYLQKYMGITDDLAFISPCIAKKGEIERPENGGRIEYNVTFDHLMHAIGNIDLSVYDVDGADGPELDYGMGALFSTSGGLRENIEYYMGLDENAYVNQKEGETHAYSYLDLYGARTDYDDPYRARLIDILNCSRGCNYGTATEFKNSASNHIPYYANKMRMEKRKESEPDGKECAGDLRERLHKLNAQFSSLNMQDFLLDYDNRHQPERVVDKNELSRVFNDMLKFTETDRRQDCSACGYDSCESMAKAIALGYNHVDNCVDYVKKKLVIEHSEAELQKLRIEELQTNSTGAAPVDLDQLTGLQNRYGMEKQFNKTLRKMRKFGQTGHVFNIDLDDFMAINKSYGHNFGNAFLSSFSQFLKKEFPDAAGLFRIGGDEFCLLYENTTDAQANAIAQRLLSRTQEAWEIMGVRLYCTVSMGIVLFPVADEGVDGIIKNADLAVHTAKSSGKNNFVVYDRSIDTDTNERVELIRQMRDDIANNFRGFEVYYQPWISREGAVVGAEALMRWKNDAGVFIPPSEFIPVAENVGLIIPLGEFVLQKAMLALRQINHLQPDFMVSVNVSVKQFNDANIFQSLYEIVKQAGVPTKNVVLEITESLGIESLSRQKLVMGRFVQTGMQVALDDFGTGYSSLSYLHELPLNIVKIDRSFINNIDNGDSYSKDFLYTMTDLIHKTGQLVCVEGVETQKQLDYCRQADVDIIQGYYYYKPAPFEELKKIIERQGAG